MNIKQTYCLGFLFSDKDDPIPRVALVKKLRGPTQNLMKWNGIGGKIEEGESPSISMSREFKEEAGVYINANLWDNFADFTYTNVETGDYSKIFCYRHFSTERLYSVRQMEEEPIHAYELRQLSGIPIVGNLDFIIPMALDENFHYASINLIEGVNK